MAFKKLTNESLWNTSQLKGIEKEELYWAVDALKGMSGREITETHSILALADWIFAYNKTGHVDLPFTVEGIELRPGNLPANFNGNSANGTCLIIGHRTK